MKIRRRDFFPLAGAGLLAGYAGWEGVRSRRNAPAGPSPVVVVKASSYSEDLAQRILQGVRECGLDVRGRKSCSSRIWSSSIRQYLHQYRRFRGRRRLRSLPVAGRLRGHHWRRPRSSPRYLFARRDGALPGNLEIRRSVRRSEPRRCEPRPRSSPTATRSIFPIPRCGPIWWFRWPR